MKKGQKVERFLEIAAKLKEEWDGGLLTLGELDSRIHNLGRQYLGDPEFRGLEIVIGSNCSSPEPNPVGFAVAMSGQANVLNALVLAPCPMGSTPCAEGGLKTEKEDLRFHCGSCGYFGFCSDLIKDDGLDPHPCGKDECPECRATGYISCCLTDEEVIKRGAVEGEYM